VNEIFLNEIKSQAANKLEYQLNSVDSTDGKIGVILGFVGVVIVLAFDKVPSNICALIFFQVSQIFFIASIVTLFFGYRAIRLQTGLSIKGYFKKLNEHAKDNDSTSFTQDQILYYDYALRENTTQLEQKNKYLSIGIILLLMGLISFAIKTQLEGGLTMAAKEPKEEERVTIDLDLMDSIQKGASFSIGKKIDHKKKKKEK
jgi:hypothetical protein